MSANRLLVIVKIVYKRDHTKYETQEHRRTTTNNLPRYTLVPCVDNPLSMTRLFSLCSRSGSVAISSRSNPAIRGQGQVKRNEEHKIQENSLSIRIDVCLQSDDVNVEK